MIRQSHIEQDSWAGLIDDEANWGWDTLYPYLKKSETWTPPTDYRVSRISFCRFDDVAYRPFFADISEAKMVLNESLHGLDGPVHYSYPGLFYNSTYEWIDTLAALGVESRDPGAFSSFSLLCLLPPADISPPAQPVARTGVLTSLLLP